MPAHCQIERAPKRPINDLSEYEIHKAVVAQVRARGRRDMVWWHTPNDAKRSYAAAQRLRNMGLREGVHDLCFLRRGNFYTLEIKTWSGRPSLDQMAFASEVNSAGGSACIVHDLDRAIRVLECWGLLQ